MNPFCLTPDTCTVVDFNESSATEKQIYSQNIAILNKSHRIMVEGGDDRYFLFLKIFFSNLKKFADALKVV